MKQPDPLFGQAALITGETIDNTASEVQLSPTYVLYMASSGVLASVALLSNSVPILIGSMIIAPLMAPLALVAFALVAGRRSQAARGLGVALAGLALAFVAAWVTTALMEAAGVVDSDAMILSKPLLQERLRPGWWSMAAAVAAGAVGAIAQAHHKTDTLIGTVAALALVPAVGASAIAVYVGAAAPTLGGLLLLTTNVGIIIAMGVTVVLLSTRRAALRPLALVPVAIVTVVGLLLACAQSTGTVPETPTSFGTDSNPWRVR